MTLFSLKPSMIATQYVLIMLGLVLMNDEVEKIKGVGYLHVSGIRESFLTVGTFKGFPFHVCPFVTSTTRAVCERFPAILTRVRFNTAVNSHMPAGK